MQQGLDEVNYKFNPLLQRVSVNHVPDYRDASALESFTTLNGAGTSLPRPPSIPTQRHRSQPDPDPEWTNT